MTITYRELEEKLKEMPEHRKDDLVKILIEGDLGETEIYVGYLNDYGGTVWMDADQINDRILPLRRGVPDWGVPTPVPRPTRFSA
jgi:PHD/YefM family antitoxin component YafN of YafNO toxin-antitoxin module